MTSVNKKRTSVAPAVASNINDDVPDETEEPFEFSPNEGTFIDGIHIPPPINPVCSFNPTGPRLIITKIVNNFFKSYAENETLGPFHKCFNAVMGPNGSGKSNVIDSMLFVFGYRATKIRCKKVSVLLHNSGTHPHVQSATVEVHFAQIIDKEGDDYDIVPGGEFVVSRTAMKDNSSYYTLDGRRVQFKEVGLLLKKHGIDLDYNRFLILQGEVEQIAMMKAKSDNPNEPGMLDYLEDIIGTTRYIKPLQQLHERVDTLTDARSEKVNRLKLVQNELEELEAPMEEAVDFIKAENTVTTCQNVLYQKNIFDLEDELKLKEADKNVIQESKDELSKKIEATSSSKDEKEAVLETESRKFSVLSKKKTTLKEAFDKASNKDVEFQAEMVLVNKNRKKNMELLVEEKRKLSRLEKVPEESEKSIVDCVKKEEQLLKQKEKMEAEKTELLASIQAETRELQQQKEVLETELIVLKRTVDETKSAFDVAKTELKLCVSKEETERNKYESMKQACEKAKSLIAERRQQVAILETKIPQTEKSLNEAVAELNAIREEEAEIREDIQRKRANLEESRSSMKASHSRTKVLDALMKQKQDGNCPGLFGRLGDLGAIDLKYDVAISTACGPLDNIVVDTVKTAQWCIEFLKRNDIGRATFIALEKQEHLRSYASSRIQTPENVHRLYDLVKIQDDRLRTAFYFALRDTLVANDLDQATRIAYGARRYRVVTLNGDLIETTGTMSGGGKRTSKGRMGQSVAVTTSNRKSLDLGELENKIKKAEDRLRSLRERQGILENQINTLEPELRKMKCDFEKYSLELKSASQQQPELENQLKAQQAKAKATKSDQLQVKKLTDTVNKRKTEYDKAEEVAQALQVQVDSLTAEINEKSLGKIKKMDKSIKDVVKQIDKVKAEMTRLKVAIKTSDRNLKKSSEMIASLEQDIKNCEERLRNLKAQREEIEADAEKLLKCITEVETEITGGEDNFNAQKKEVEKLKKQINKLKTEEVDVDQRLNSANAKINEIKSNKHHWNVKISKLELQEIPNISIESLKTYTKEELEEKNMEVVERDLKVAENKIKTTKPNLSAIQEYRKKQDQFMDRSKELEEISQKRQDMKGFYDKLREQRKQEFLTGFQTIRLKLKEMYQMITLGGDADLELVDTFDPFTEGVNFNVRPPKKSWKKISNLSGGEKTLSSLALVFALHYYKPSPLYVMDEIDAALDFKNVSIVGHYIKERTKNAQFIIISLRSQMFELGDHLVGIYKIFNCTQSITIDPRVFDQENEVAPTSQVHAEDVESAETNAVSNIQYEESSKSSQEFNDEKDQSRSSEPMEVD